MLAFNDVFQFVAAMAVLTALYLLYARISNWWRARRVLAGEQIEAGLGEAVAEKLHIVAQLRAQIVTLGREFNSFARTGDDCWRHGVGKEVRTRALA